MEPHYHLWLKPSGQAYDVLVEAIWQLSRKLQAPFFEPHVTLLGSLNGTEHLRRAKQLALELRPLSITLTAPLFGSEYFRCVFMKVEQTAEIMSANARARRVFGHGGEAVYLPHVSLLYGLYPEATKREVIETLPTHRMTFDATVLYLIRADSDDPKDWHEISSVPMGRGKSIQDGKRKA